MEHQLLVVMAVRATLGHTQEIHMPVEVEAELTLAAQ
jgi:hypothetical protein